MLVLSRKGGEQLRIGDEIAITVLSIQGNRVKIGIEAPGEYRIVRAELSHWDGTEPSAPVECAKPAPRPLQSASSANKPAPEWCHRHEHTSRQLAKR